ncbi:MAG: nickel pincer cofactor biosynthesis protein LarB [Myxococcales bacterium]|nr:nickel pincer cofactor biosynthesis protein LarB [Myxococcales bacterium]
MDETWLRSLLGAVASGAVPVENAVAELRQLPYVDLGFAKLDHHRALRTGVPEIVFAQGKQTDHLLAIVQELARTGQNVLCTRVSAAQAEALAALWPAADYHALSKLWFLPQRPIAPTGLGTVVVACAGTADLPVAEEAARTAEYLGSSVERIVDIGVAGLHRTLAAAPRLRRAAVVVVVAGMEGALASVVGGLCGRPVIAVPTSVGYGANFQGLSALLTMLTSCAAGVTVVNIDNGFGAGYTAALINRGLPSAAVPASLAGAGSPQPTASAVEPTP